MSPRRARAVSGRVGDDPATALREHLLDTAEALIAEVPVTSITTREIARRAGVSDGVLYNYFEDKNDLLVAALLRRYRRVVERFEARIPDAGTDTIEDNLSALAAALFDLAAEVVPMVAGLLVDPLLFHRVFAAIHEAPFGPQQIREPLIRYLEGEQRLGRLAPDLDREAVSLLVIGPTSMLAVAEHVGPMGADLAGAEIRRLVGTLMRGLRAPE